MKKLLVLLLCLPIAIFGQFIKPEVSSNIDPSRVENIGSKSEIITIAPELNIVDNKKKDWHRKIKSFSKKHEISRWESIKKEKTELKFKNLNKSESVEENIDKSSNHSSRQR